jgi:2-polyprenyl-3-methyl-5-hydroxy-6-metoxy-1,4-benzoquinol methylase
MAENTGEEETVDLAKVMVSIQEAAAQRGRLVDRYFAELRSQIPGLLTPEEIAEMMQTQHEANELFSRLRMKAASENSLSRSISFMDLARIPGTSRPWSDPRRWIAALLKPIFWRQERFNVEVVRRMHGGDEASLDPHVALTARLLGNMNTMVRRAADSERAMAEWTATLLSRFETLIEQKGSAYFAQAAPKALPQKEPQREPAPKLANQFATIASDIKALANELQRQIAALNEKIVTLESDQRRARALLDKIQDSSDRTSGTSTLHVQHPPPPPAPFQLDENPITIEAPEFDFLVFESLTRGEEATISAEQSKYIPFFAKSSNVLDAGCGRGEFLELLRKAGVQAYGVDSDTQMVEHCQSKGLNVMRASLFDHLQSVPDDSLGGIFLGQVVEHLPFDALSALPVIAMRKLKPGCYLIAETINPTCLTTFSGAFYADPTHQKPLHPKALEYFFHSAGFRQIQILFSAPVPPANRLQPIREKSPVEPAIKELVLQANENIDRLNSLLYSYGNYAIAGMKPIDRG